jgi:hypothetical protein
VRYGVIAEDGYILRAVPALLSRLVRVEGAHVECRQMNGKGDFCASFSRPVKEFQYRYPDMHKVFAICDGDEESPEELEAWLAARANEKLFGLPCPLVFHVIKKELETWWVADPRSVSVVTGVEVPYPGGNVEEDVSRPKEYMTGRLSRRKVPYTPAVAEEIAKSLDLEAVAARCPGFVLFRRKVEDGGPERPGSRLRRIER